MELKIGSQDLARALGRSQGIVERKSTMPILSHVLLEARKGNELQISATDLDLSVSSTHTCEVAREGAVAVPAKHLYEIVRALPEQTVTLKRASNNYLEVKSGPSEFRIVGLPAEDFPALPRFEKLNFVDVDPKSLLDQIERTFFAASNDETRYNLNGVFFEPQGAVLRLVATDGHRLTVSERPLAGDFALKKGVILPKKGLQELRKLLTEAAESGQEKPSSQLGFAENSAVFKRPGVILVITGAFDFQPSAIEEKTFIGSKFNRAAAEAGIDTVHQFAMEVKFALQCVKPGRVHIPKARGIKPQRLAECRRIVAAHLSLGGRGGAQHAIQENGTDQHSAGLAIVRVLNRGLNRYFPAVVCLLHRFDENTVVPDMHTVLCCQPDMAVNARALIPPAFKCLSIHPHRQHVGLVPIIGPVADIHVELCVTAVIAFQQRAIEIEGAGRANPVKNEGELLSIKLFSQ